MSGPVSTTRRFSRAVQAGSLRIGGGAPVSVQSMTNTDTRDVAATVVQIERLAMAGCDLVRLAVPDMEAADALARIRAQVRLPLAADIHFDHRLALAALRAGADKLRLNPGNIGGREAVTAVARAAAERGVPIRIGVNAGSLDRSLLARHGGRPTADALVESALSHVALLTDAGYGEIVVSLKSSDVAMTVTATRRLAARCDWPIHLGVTEAGTARAGTVASAIGIGSLLLEGVGDTLRVSLTAPPEEEVRVGHDILTVLGQGRRGPRLVSCPSCGRSRVDLVALVLEVERRLADISEPIQVAVMGCEVNGPGEAAEADIGVACGTHSALLLERGQVVGKLPHQGLAEAFAGAVRDFLRRRAGGAE